MNKMYILRRLKHKFGLYDKHISALNRFVFRTLLFLVLLGSVLLSGINKIGPLAVSLGTSKLENDISYECTEIISRLLSESNITYHDIVTEKVGSDNKITSLSIDFDKINFLKKSTLKELSEYMNSLRKVEIGVPSGALLSNDFLTGRGFEIPASIAVSGTATVEFGDDFISEGINQTKHRLMLSICVNATIYGAFCRENKTINFDVPLTEGIIVGDVSGILIQKSVDN